MPRSVLRGTLDNCIVNNSIDELDDERDSGIVNHVVVFHMPRVDVDPFRQGPQKSLITYLCH